eukprot:g38006.t1
MQNLLLLQTMEVDVTVAPQEVKSHQASLFASEASKLIFWSRVHTVQQDETCLTTPVLTDHLKVLGIRIGRAGACTKFWEERIAVVKQKLGFWDHCSLSIAALLSICPASLPQNTPTRWTVPYHLSFVEKFVKKNTFDHKAIRKWAARVFIQHIRFILNHNIIIFDNQFFIQTHGTAMGIKFEPQYANIFMHKFKQDFFA